MSPAAERAFEVWVREARAARWPKLPFRECAERGHAWRRGTCVNCGNPAVAGHPVARRNRILKLRGLPLQPVTYPWQWTAAELAKAERQKAAYMEAGTLPGEE